MTDQKPKSCTMYFQQGTSDKVYKAEIIKDDEGWTVNGWNGRRGNTLLQQCKGEGMSYNQAEVTYLDLVKSKLKKGYKMGQEIGGYVAPVSAKPPVKPAKPAPTAEIVEADIFAGLGDLGEPITTGYMPQLLDEITEDEAQPYLLNVDYLVQEKENGKRGGITSEGGEVFVSNKKGIKVGCPGKVLDEAVALNRKFEMDGELVGELYKAYDLFSLDGKDLRGFSYIKRYEMLLDLIADCQSILPTKTAYTTKEKIALFNWLKSNNREGAVLKLKDSTFKAGKGHKEHLKCKFWATCCCLVSKINAKRSVALQMLDGKTLVDVGNCSIPPNKDVPAPQSLIEVRYLYIANKGGFLYQPFYMIEKDDQEQPDDVLTLKINKKDE